jgi:hypothetical protein
MSGPSFSGRWSSVTSDALLLVSTAAFRHRS